MIRKNKKPSKHLIMNSKSLDSWHQRLSEISALDWMNTLSKEIDAVNDQTQLSIEQQFGYVCTSLRRHLKYAALKAYQGLLATPNHPSLEWFEVVLIASERLHDIERTENWLPRRYIDPRWIGLPRVLPNPLESLRPEFDDILARQAEWDEQEQIYRSAVLFLQWEYVSQHYQLDIDREAVSLHDRRKLQLEQALKVLEEWRSDGHTRSAHAHYYDRFQRELEHLRPRRLLDRIMCGVTAKPNELVTEVDVTKMPRIHWPKRRHTDQRVILTLTTTHYKDLQDHLKHPDVVAQKQRWKQATKRHQRRMAELAHDAAELTRRGELDFRIQLRYEKRISELQEEGAVLKTWLACGLLYPAYGSRFIDLQLEILSTTMASLYRQVHEPISQELRETIAQLGNV